VDPCDDVGSRVAARKGLEQQLELEPAPGLKHKIDSKEVAESSQNLTKCRPKVDKKLEPAKGAWLTGHMFYRHQSEGFRSHDFQWRQASSKCLIFLIKN
jgi:hypothetical protein